MPCGVPCRAAFESDKMVPAHIGQSPTHSATHRWDTLLACLRLTDSSRPQALAARKVVKQSAGGNGLACGLPLALGLLEMPLGRSR